jgi:hypothetical protein
MSAINYSSNISPEKSVESTDIYGGEPDRGASKPYIDIYGRQKKNREMKRDVALNYAP